MNKSYIYIQCLVLFLITSTFSYSQDISTTSVTNTEATVDTLQNKKKFFERIVNYFEEAKKDKSQSKFDISFIGGPSYSVDTQLGLGMVASGIYRMDKENLALPPSDLAIYTNLTTSGFFSIGIENTTIFPDDKYRLYYDMSFKYMPTKYYGIGYDAGDAGEYSKYDEYQLGLKLDATRRVLPNTYIGATFSALNIQSKNFKDGTIRPENEEQNTMIGGGLVATYDTRDFNPNPSKGLYIKFEQIYYPKALGSNRSFGKINFTTRAYQQVWKNGILAFDANAEITQGDVPWTMLSQIGGSRQMRGYLKGQYRDRNQINTQVELRQKIYNRHGIAVWGGAGNVFENKEKLQLSHTLPTYGIGYRWEFKNRVNIRLDYGFGKGQNGFYFNVNESF